MKTRTFRLVSGCLLVIVALAGCNLPMSPTPTAFVFPTPNMTMTALFNPTANLPATVTLAAGGAEATQAPPPAASPTSAPAATNTTAVTRVPTQALPTVPVATATIPGVRPGTAVEAPFLTKAPTIDGDWSDWGNVKAYAANAVVFGKSNWKDSADQEASFRVAWDNNNLYIAVKVLDDAYVQNATGKLLFQGDSVEILLDTDVKSDFYVQKVSPDDFQLGMSPGNPTPGTKMEAYLWVPTSIEGAVTNIKMAAVSSSGVWRLEAAIPWSVFETTASDGKHFGFALSVSDNDNPAKNEQQTMVSSASKRDFTDPTTWGDLKLVK